MSVIEKVKFKPVLLSIYIGFAVGLIAKDRGWGVNPEIKELHWSIS